VRDPVAATGLRAGASLTTFVENLSWRHGLSPKARQISLTLWRLIPCRSASDRVDHAGLVGA